MWQMKLQGMKKGPTLILSAFRENDIGDGSFQNQHPYSRDEFYYLKTKQRIIKYSAEVPFVQNEQILLSEKTPNTTKIHLNQRQKWKVHCNYIDRVTN